MTTQPEHVQRVINERVELKDKIDKLLNFMQGDVFRALMPHDRYLLAQQLKHMTSYHEVLEARISIFANLHKG